MAERMRVTSFMALDVPGAHRGRGHPSYHIDGDFDERWIKERAEFTRDEFIRRCGARIRCQATAIRFEAVSRSTGRTPRGCTRSPGLAPTSGPSAAIHPARGLESCSHQ